MRILAVLLTVSLVRLCHGKGGSKKPPTQPATPAAKGQATPQAPQNPPKDPTTSKESPVVQPAPQQTAKPGSVPEVKQEQKPAKNLQGSVKKEQALPPPEQQEAARQDTTITPTSESQTPKEDVSTETTQSPGQGLSSGNTNANREATPPKPTTPVPLNLSNPDTSKLEINTRNDEGVNSKKYSPKDGHHISSVVNADKELWTAKDKEKCLLAGSYAKGDIELLYLDIDNNGRFDYQYFEKVDGKWNGITQGDFLKKLKERYNPDNILDLTSPDSSKANVKNEEDKGLKHKNFSLKHDCVISLVVDGKAMLWTASGKEECLSAKLSSKGDSSLAMIWVYAGSSSGYKYFEKNANGEWKKITEEEHAKKLKELQPPTKPEVSTEAPQDTTTRQSTPPAESPEDDEPGNGSESDDMGDTPAVPQTPTGAPTGQPKEPTSLSDLKSKVDSTLFDLEESEEDAVKVLKLKAKEGTSTNKLTFDGVSLWQGQNSGDSFLMATFYLGKEGLIGASYRFKRENDGKTVEGYRQFSGGKWTQVNGTVFKKLIGKDKPVTTSKEPSTNEGAKDKPKPTSTVAPPSEESKKHLKGASPKDTIEKGSHDPSGVKKETPLSADQTGNDDTATGEGKTDATFTESKEVTEVNELITVESASSEDPSHNSSSYPEGHSPTGEPVLVGSDQNEQTVTEHKDLQSDDSAKDVESPNPSSHPS